VRTVASEAVAGEAIPTVTFIAAERVVTVGVIMTQIHTRQTLVHIFTHTHTHTHTHTRPSEDSRLS